MGMSGKLGLASHRPENSAGIGTLAEQHRCCNCHPVAEASLGRSLRLSG